MSEYLNMWKNYFNFVDRTTRRGYWMAFLVNLVIVFALATPVAFFPRLVFLHAVYGLYVLALIIPYFAIQIRRLRDAGRGWYNILWVLVPLVGQIIYLVLLCLPSVERNDVPVV